MAIKKPEATVASREDLLEILTVAAQGQLRALRALRRRQRPLEPDSEKRRSHIAIVEDILRSSPGPLHISQILTQAQERYQLQLSRESLVSALTKKVLDRNTFCRVGRNTFDLLERPPS
jgi:hypothetical protein